MTCAIFNLFLTTYVIIPICFLIFLMKIHIVEKSDAYENPRCCLCSQEKVAGEVKSFNQLTRS